VFFLRISLLFKNYESTLNVYKIQPLHRMPVSSIVQEEFSKLMRQKTSGKEHFFLISENPNISFGNIKEHTTNSRTDSCSEQLLSNLLFLYSLFSLAGIVQQKLDGYQSLPEGCCRSVFRNPVSLCHVHLVQKEKTLINDALWPTEINRGWAAGTLRSASTNITC